MADAFRVGLVQMSCSPDPEKNLNRAIDFVREAAGRGAQVVCLPELFRTQYFCQREDATLFDLAEPIPGPTTTRLTEVARQQKVAIVASVFEKRAVGVYHNTAAVIDANGSLLGIYRKMHIPDDPLYHEKFYFAPGDMGFRSFQTSQGSIGVLVCWDQWFPEAARATALAGADILLYPTAIGWHPAEKAEYGRPQREAWELVQRSHAVANGCFVCVPNRIGHEVLSGPDGKPASAAGIEFWGSSFIAGPDGQVIARGSADQEEILRADLDLGKVEFSRVHWPFLRDRRIDAYGVLLGRFGK